MIAKKTFLLSVFTAVIFLEASNAKTICTGDFTNYQVGLNLGLVVSKACITEDEREIRMSAQLTGGPLVLEGMTKKQIHGEEAIYVNLRESGGIETRTTVRMKAKDRIRSEGAMAEHFVGGLEIAQRQGRRTKFTVKRRLDGLHFYTGTPEHEIHWGYHANVGPENWGKIKPEWQTCLSGQRQSPIALSVSEATAISGKKIKLDYKYLSASLVNNGHALQANLSEGSSFTIGGKRFKLLQFHAHTPSEHTLNGKEYPMEIHLVHQGEDKSFAVIGVFVDTPKDAPVDQALALALNEFPREINDPKEFSGKVNPERWLPPVEHRAYFNYSGSLTTPPCSENVNWFVLSEPIKLAADQVATIHDLIRSENSRHLPGGKLLPVNERIVLYSGN